MTRALSNFVHSCPGRRRNSGGVSATFRYRSRGCMRRDACPDSLNVDTMLPSRGV